MELNNWLQANGGTGPLSCATSRLGAHHDPTWNAKIFSTFVSSLSSWISSAIFCPVNGVLYGEGEAMTKKGAKEVAAEQALARLKLQAAGV